MKELQILIELVGELRSENAILKEQGEKASESTAFWYKKYKELEESLKEVEPAFV